MNTRIARWQRAYLLWLSVVLAVLCGEVASAKNTYVWNRTGTASWTVPTNWTPTRSLPEPDDVLKFINGANVIVTDVPTETIARLLLHSNTIVNLQAGATNTLTIRGGDGTDLDIGIGSALNITGTQALTIFVDVGATASISGSMTFTNSLHRLNANDANGILFCSGSSFTQASGCTGNVFTASGNPGVVVFKNGSRFVSQAGANPFGLAQPSSKVIFQTGSLYVHEQTGAASWSGRTYADFEMNHGPANISGSGSNPCSVDNLTVTAGTLNLGMTGAFSIKGNILVQSGTTLNFNPATAATVTLNGTALQTIAGAGTLTFLADQNVTVDNANGIVLGRNVTINGTLTFVNGKLTLGANQLTIGSAGSITGANASRYVVTDTPLSGRLTRNGVGTAPVSFPIGTPASFNPVVIATGSGTDNFSASVAVGILPHADDTTAAVHRTWNLAEGTPGGNGTITVTFQWNLGEEGSTFVRTFADGWRNDGASWVRVTNSLTSITAGTTYPASATVSATMLSPWTVANSNAALPIQLASFSGSVVNGGVRLDWSTLSEVNNYGFYVQRRAQNASTFTTLSNSFVPGHGTTNVPQYYTYTDYTAGTGTWFYRLKQVDLDNTVHYSEPIQVSVLTDVKENTPAVFLLRQNYPNPFNPTTEIKFTVDATTHTTLDVYNMVGQRVATLFDGLAEVGQYYAVKLDGSQLPSGVYFYRLQNEKKSELKKMMLLK